MEPDIGHPGGQLKERIDHGLDVLDGCQTHHRADIHPAILLFERDIAEPLVLDAVWDDDALFSIAPHLDLRPAGIIEQTADPERPPVDLLRKDIEEPDPSALERGHHPLCTNDFFLTFAGVDSMFRKKHRRMIQAAAQTGQQTAVAGGDRMVDIRFRHPARKQVEHRQQHRAHGMERIRISHIRILLQADIGEQLHKIPALQKRERVDAFFLKQTVQHIPIRAAQPYQFPQGGTLVCSKQDRLPLPVEAEGIIQKNLLHLFHVGRQLIHKLSPVLCFGTDDPEGELLLRHGLNIRVHPCGYAAVNIGIRPFQHQTDAHGHAPFFSIRTVSALALSR